MDYKCKIGHWEVTYNTTKINNINSIIMEKKTNKT